MEQRECKHCKQVKDLTPTNFFVDTLRGKNGYRATCKECETEKKKATREQNRDDLNEKQKEYYQKNRAKIREQRKRIREESKDKINEQKKKTYEANKEIVKCDCGAEMLKHNLARHLKYPTTQHENYLLHKK